MHVSGGLGLGYFLGISPVITAAVFAVASALESRVRLRATECAKTRYRCGVVVGHGRRYPVRFSYSWICA